MQTAYPYILIHSLLLGKNKGKKVCYEVYLLLVMTNTTVKNISARDNSTVVPTIVAVVPDIVSYTCYLNKRKKVYFRFN